MPIPVKCTSCEKKYQVPDNLAGKLVFCPTCKLSLDVPAPEHVPTVDEIEVLEEEDASGPATYGLNEPLDDGISNLAAAAAGGFGGAMGIIKTSREATCLAYSSGNRYGLAGMGRDVLVMDMRASKKIGRFEDHDDPVTALALSGNALAALSGDQRGELYLWQLEATRVVRRMRAHRGAVLCCAIAPNGKYAISGGDDGAVRLWDLTTAQQIELLNGTWDEPVTAIAYSHDGKHILAGSEHGRVGVWSVRTGEKVLKFRGGRDAIESVTFSFDNSEAIAAAFSKTSECGVMAWRWLTHSGQSLPAFSNPSQNSSTLYCLALYPHGQKIACGAEWEEIISYSGGGGTSSGMAAAAVMGGLVGAMIYSAATNAGEVSENRCGVQCMTVEGGIRGQKIHGVSHPVREIVVSPDGARALGALEGGDLAVFALPP